MEFEDKLFTKSELIRKLGSLHLNLQGHVPRVNESCVILLDVFGVKFFS